jgi:uncharacterized repeat protein (TIGR03803 family)
LVQIYDFNDIENFDTQKINPVSLIISQDGDWIYGLNAGGASTDGYIFRIRTNGNDFKKLTTFNETTGYQQSRIYTNIVEHGNYIYGALNTGGEFNKGSIFRISKNGNEEIKLLHHFDTTTGDNPQGSLALNGDGYIYGVTVRGGPTGRGTVYRIKPSDIEGASKVETLVYSFTGDANIDGQSPVGLKSAPNGKLYGPLSNVNGAVVYALNVGHTPPNPIIASFASNQPEVTWLGDANQPKTRLTWEVTGPTGYTTCTASGDWSGTKDLSGSEEVTVLREGNNTYTLTCDNGSGLENATSTQTVVVKAVTPPPPVAISSFSATPSTIESGGSVRFGWATQNAVSCTGSWSGSNLPADQLASGWADFSPSTEPGEKTYTLNCKGRGGDEQSLNTTVTVTTAQTGGNDGGGSGDSIKVEGGGPLAWLLVPLAGLALLRRRRAGGLPQ